MPKQSFKQSEWARFVVKLFFCKKDFVEQNALQRIKDNKVPQRFKHDKNVQHFSDDENFQSFKHDKHFQHFRDNDVLQRFKYDGLQYHALEYDQVAAVQDQPPTSRERPRAIAARAAAPPRGRTASPDALVALGVAAATLRNCMAPSPG